MTAPAELRALADELTAGAQQIEDGWQQGHRTMSADYALGYRDAMRACAGQARSRACAIERAPAVWQLLAWLRRR